MCHTTSYDEATNVIVAYTLYGEIGVAFFVMDTSIVFVAADVLKFFYFIVYGSSVVLTIVPLFTALGVMYHLMQLRLPVV